MATLLPLVAFSALIAAQFLAAVFAYQLRTGFPASVATSPPAITVVHRAA